MVDARRAKARKSSLSWMSPLARTPSFYRRSALAAALLLSVAPRFASAEVFDPLRGYSFDGTPVGPGRPADRRASPEAVPDAPRAAPAYVSPAAIRRAALRSGYKLAEQPRRHGRAYVVAAEDDKGHRFRLVFSAFNGQLVNRTDIGIADVKPADTKPADVKPADVKAVDARPAETKATDIKAADVKGTDVKGMGRQGGRRRCRGEAAGSVAGVLRRCLPHRPKRLTLRRRRPRLP